MAAALRGRVRMCFADGYAPVGIDFRGDVSALIATPLAAGLPNPTTRRGRHAIARLADGRVDFDGPLALARNLLRLLAVDASGAAKPSHLSGPQRT